MIHQRIPDVVLVSILALVGCSKSGEPASSTQTENATTAEKSKPVILATTTSTHDSGLLDQLIPHFEQRTGMTVKTVAVGTGQALELGRRGEADVLLVHAPSAEEEFVAQGHGRNRRGVMHNDFVIVGPRADPAGIAGGGDAIAALKVLAGKAAPWISRGDRSGTHHKERGLWREAGIEPKGEWFIESGQGMGATLRIANERQAYTLTDRGTLLSVDNLELVVRVEGDKRLFNPYHVIEVTHVNANQKGARVLANFFLEQQTQQRIAAFRSHGEALFVPDALK